MLREKTAPAILLETLRPSPTGHADMCTPPVACGCGAVQLQAKPGARTRRGIAPQIPVPVVGDERYIRIAGEGAVAPGAPAPHHLGLHGRACPQPRWWGAGAPGATAPSPAIR